MKWQGRRDTSLWHAIAIGGGPMVAKLKRVALGEALPQRVVECAALEMRGLRRLPRFTSQQCLYPVEIREISKELQLAGLELCRETFHEETP